MNPISVSSPPSKVAAWVGLDWADQQHLVCLYDVGTGQTELSCLEQKPEALQSWLGQLRQRFGGQPVAVVLDFEPAWQLVQQATKSSKRASRAGIG